MEMGEVDPVLSELPHAKDKNMLTIIIEHTIISIHEPCDERMKTDNSKNTW